jgi:hypothetical protein
MGPRDARLSIQARRRHAAGQSILLVVDGQLAEPVDWSDLVPLGPSKLCRSCGRILPLACFRPQTVQSEHGPVLGTEPDCVVCEYDERLAYRRANLWEDAARQRLADHMQRERKQGLHNCRSVRDYELLTGVTVEWLADLMRHAYETNAACHHCESVGRRATWQVACPIDEDGLPDLHRMTIDRTDPARLLARDNLTLMCLTGNIAKNSTDPDTYNVRQAYWRRHNADLGGPVLFD